MTHPYIVVWFAMERQHELASRTPQHLYERALRPRRSLVDRARARLRRRTQLGHVRGAPGKPLGCAA